MELLAAAEPVPDDKVDAANLEDKGQECMDEDIEKLVFSFIE